MSIWTYSPPSAPLGILCWLLCGIARVVHTVLAQNVVRVCYDFPVRTTYVIFMSDQTIN